MARKRPRSGAIVATVAPIVVLFASFIIAACTAAPPEVTIDDPELVRGREVYSSSCASCHGSDGGGGVGLKLSEGAVVASIPTVEEQMQLVSDGRKNMPAYGDRLDQDEIRAVVRYTREIL